MLVPLRLRGHQELPHPWEVVLQRVLQAVRRLQPDGQGDRDGTVPGVRVLVPLRVRERKGTRRGQVCLSVCPQLFALN